MEDREMNLDDKSGIMPLIISWLTFLSSFADEITPIVRVVLMGFGIVSSFYAIKHYRKRLGN
jgi:hypothetical protein